MVSTQHVFISYSRKDYYFAESLAFNFVKRGIDAWLDAKDLVPGADWVQQIEAAIDGASCLILVVSRGSLKSATVRREVHRARDQGKRIIALLFRRRTIQADWGITETIDFRGFFEPALDDLMVRLDTMSAGAAGRSAHRPAGACCCVSRPG